MSELDKIKILLECISIVKVSNSDWTNHDDMKEIISEYYKFFIDLLKETDPEEVKDA